MKRCRWADPNSELYIAYHDREWGRLEHDDQKLFEMLILEGFQAGLSWECILNKREAFRQAFDGFDLEKVCGYGQEKLERLMQEPGIVRNKLKIRAAVNNARIFRTIQQEWGSFDRYLWHWTGGKSLREVGCATSPLSMESSRQSVTQGRTPYFPADPQVIIHGENNGGYRGTDGIDPHVLDGIVL